MASLETTDLQHLAQAILSGADGTTQTAQRPSRPLSIWEITTWILPMASEHLRRVLAQNPALPQGVAGAEGGTRWFAPADMQPLRAHFAQSARKNRYLPPRPVGAQAAVVAMTGPQGGTGRTTALLHLATAAALAGYRVLVVDADPGGQLAASLGAAPVAGSSGGSAGVLSLLAQGAGQHLRGVNQSRLDRGEEPLAIEDAMAEALTGALNLSPGALVEPSRWPGLDVVSARPAMMLGDLQITNWRMALRGWQPWRAMAASIEAAGWRQSYDLILCDTGRGLGPLALSVLASADVLVMPVPLHEADAVSGAVTAMSQGLAVLADAMASLDQEAQRNARARGQAAQPFHWRRVLALPTRVQGASQAALAGLAARLAGGNPLPSPFLLPNPLPEVPQLAAAGVGQVYDLDYRDVGRLAYAPLRDATEAAWQGLSEVLITLWAEDAAARAPQASLSL